jgi:hypothetical protein
MNFSPFHSISAIHPCFCFRKLTHNLLYRLRRLFSLPADNLSIRIPRFLSVEGRVLGLKALPKTLWKGAFAKPVIKSMLYFSYNQ